eukprot:TRINITY_DN7023_c0_g1_i1.p1 TRINITY_DN7023_c0_g1~~TRINITY_DN7023_c0_g1_i1.p1  ORF type:complete len:187 (+),score=22.85 TRINITY_DN7023_c0_g1_i1:46-561(+)
MAPAKTATGISIGSPSLSPLSSCSATTFRGTVMVTAPGVHQGFKQSQRRHRADVKVLGPAQSLPWPSLRLKFATQLLLPLVFAFLCPRQGAAISILSPAAGSTQGIGSSIEAGLQEIQLRLHLHHAVVTEDVRQYIPSLPMSRFVGESDVNGEGGEAALETPNSSAVADLP